MEVNKKLYRSKSDRMLFGVCGGLGAYFGIDSLIFRGLFLLMSFGGGAGILVYVIMAILVPLEPGEGAVNDNHGHAKEQLNNFAHQVREGAQNLAQEMRGSHSTDQAPTPSGRKGWVGLVLVAFGCFFILNAIFPQTWARWDLFWPAVLILVGLVIMARRR